MSEETCRLKQFLRVLNVPTVDVAKLRKMSWHGVPFSVRNVVWKYLFNYIPSEVSRVDKVLQKKRSEYQTYTKMLSYELTEIEEKTLRQIRLDISRSTTEVPLLSHKVAQKTMENVLFLWALRNPACGYIQGLNDLVIPIFTVFLEEYSPLKTPQIFEDISSDATHNVEADLYWCFSSLMMNIQDHYTSNQSQIFKQLEVMKKVVGEVDKPLDVHFEENNILFFQFAFRWINCFLLRELSPEQGMRLWDTYLSDDDGNGFSHFHVYVCVSLIEKYKAKLMKMEFAEAMQFLQNIPSRSWSGQDMEELISRAFVMYKTFEKEPRSAEE
ncbi:hypothetical protein EIN_185080 [Entamoeba invadens IP1]|uniref:hypothetical protein n=1 Tax=Entamoeba invadens IP1 TaxID=370355 RepID=UPI0002C3D1C1|nr:hypothetical protein EIN_185080 [Entamoeba invadens IP1]ELP94131.1 hypothetical protein EIN_185080 [Entamoeba invadens IP1]|eukprot:XP_004260902.1 hypothetical protein EIN_185080 [Entamoeba invadens IP1]